jgi:hypothetical protein
MKTFLGVAVALLATTAFAYAGNAPTPAPLLGAVAGPWGLVASALGYGAYRYYKSRG